MKTWKKFIIVSGISLTLILTLFWLGYYLTGMQITPKSVSANTSTSNLKQYREEDLAEFNGNDPNKPIYIGMNGFVFDVSAGREYYQSDGPYHYLAGKDSSEELNQVGGGIIKSKYPVIGKLIK